MSKSDEKLLDSVVLQSAASSGCTSLWDGTRPHPDPSLLLEGTATWSWAVSDDVARAGGILCVGDRAGQNAIVRARVLGSGAKPRHVKGRERAVRCGVKLALTSSPAGPTHDSPSDQGSVSTAAAAYSMCHHVSYPRRPPTGAPPPTTTQREHMPHTLFAHAAIHYAPLVFHCYSHVWYCPFIV